MTRPSATEQKGRWWEIDGGVGDFHTVMLDANGTWWGCENISPRDVPGLTRALLGGVNRWHSYDLKEVSNGPV
jgi:hypothetical protein